MKRCPTCEKTFDDSMRFCQADGTPLVPDAEPTDPYKTMVARQEDIAAAIPPAAPKQETPPPKEEEVLQLPDEPDPLKTMYASEAEIRSAMADDKKDEVIEIPPLAPPEPPKFEEPSLSPPSFGDVSPPPSPFSSKSEEAPANPTTPPIPSPFSEPKSAPKPPEFKEPEPVFPKAASGPFDATPPAAAQAEWTPPPAPKPSTVPQNLGTNEPMQNAPVSASPKGQNQTLAIVSLVAGILGLTVCCGALLPSLLAMILGFMAKSKATNDPVNYGGKGLALGGIITGLLGLIGTIAVWIFAIFFNGLALLMQSAR